MKVWDRDFRRTGRQWKNNNTELLQRSALSLHCLRCRPLMNEMVEQDEDKGDGVFGDDLLDEAGFGKIV